MHRIFIRVFAASFCALLWTISLSAAERSPNVIFFLIDDMGWTDLGCMGSDLYQTPHIDTLAARGMKFMNAYSACTVCSPTRSAVMTGKYPARTHVTDWIHGHKRPQAKLKIPAWTEYLPFEEVTIASTLKPAGYFSASVGKWHLGDNAEHYPTKYGFDENVAGYGAGQPPSYFAPYKIPTLKDGPVGECLTDRLGDEVCQIIEREKSRPFFLYVPHYAVHTPLQGKQPLIDKYQALVKPGMRHTNAVYAAMIESLDDSVGKVLAKLDELKLTDNTLIVFTSDNGGLLRSTSNTPARVGKGSAYEGGVRIPLLIQWPKMIKPGTVCEEPVISVDHYPTLLAVANATGDKKHNENVDGVSLLPLWRDPAAKLDRDAIYWHYPHYHPGGATPYSAVRARDWKLIEFFEDNHVELYNLRGDFGETTNLASSEPAKAEELRKQLHAWREKVGAQLPTPNPDYNPNPPKQAQPKKAGAKEGKNTPQGN